MTITTGKKPAGGPGWRERVAALHADHAGTAARFFESQSGVVETIAGVLIEAFRARRTVFFFGNGGSAADAQHLAAEFVNRFRADRPALPSVALTTDTSVLTSIGNDSDFGAIFSRQIEALGRPGDVAVGLTTSGRSRNVLEGLRASRSRTMVTVGFTGGDGTPMRELCDHLVEVPSRDTARIQEVHILVGHILCQIVDDVLFPAG